MVRELVKLLFCSHTLHIPAEAMGGLITLSYVGAQSGSTRHDALTANTAVSSNAVF